MWKIRRAGIGTDLFGDRGKLLGQRVHGFIRPTTFDGGVSGVHFIGVDQNNAVLRRNMIAAGAVERLCTALNHTHGIPFMAVARKILCFVLRIKQLKAAKFFGNLKFCLLFNFAG
ncbi:Uncharacterised protein [Vibrio cholerae]|nr:Uncharacterised protein [Vibrio cholerae]CSB36059.1 Uncharacterised protein [Vibrio cholerae]